MREPSRIQNPPTSSRIGRFVVLRKLGEGGMGVVYAAYDEELDRKVAVKLLRKTGGSPEARARLAREAQAMARLSHPNVVAIYEEGDFAGQVFVAMEFIQGKTLRAWAQEKTRTAPDILAMYLQAGRGLAAAHRAGLVHRDFKPDNVLVGDDGRARVLDFGLARFVGERDDDPSAAEGLPVADGVMPPEAALHDGEPLPPPADGSALKTPITREGTMIGTPVFMAPEQIKGETITDKSDQWSFCVALYMAIYGAHPFGATFEEIVYNVSKSEICPTPEESDAPERLRDVIVRGLSTDPLARWPSMDHLLVELERELAVDPDLDVRKVRRIRVITAFYFVVLSILVTLGFELIEPLVSASTVSLFVVGVLWVPIILIGAFLTRRWLWKGIHRTVTVSIIIAVVAMALNRALGMLFQTPIAQVLASDLVVMIAAFSVAASVADRTLWLPVATLALTAIVIAYSPDHAVVLFVGMSTVAIFISALAWRRPST